jgi:nitroreductase
MVETLDIKEIKAVQTQFSVAPFITARFSPRAFADTPLSHETMNTLFEAASWAASAMNEQPWVYFYALKGTDGFEKISDCLIPFNKSWAHNAAALVVSVARKTYAANGHHNIAAEHDLGMANTNLLLQAADLEIFSHVMGGFDRAKAAEILNLDENHSPMCVIALGYLGELEQLEEPLKSLELMPRNRKPVNEFTKQI